MRRLSIGEVHEQKIAELGLDPSALDLTSIESIAGALRRTASFLCPCTAPTLVRGVIQPLRGLVDDFEATKAIVEDTLDAMISHGDILEHRDIEESQTNKNSALLYTAPPSFVARKSGKVMLLGIVSDQLSALPDDLQARIEYLNHLRWISPNPSEDLRNELLQLGLIELQNWLRMPPFETTEQHVLKIDHFLDSAQPSRDVPGLLLLDSERPVHYYPSRWVGPRNQSGRFVARRNQAYGAQLWCYVKMLNGNPERLIDFPIAGSRWRGCDEAWRLQIALDAKRGNPQCFKIRQGPNNTCVIEFFSPIPMWARRRWDAVGVPLLKPGCLFAYRINSSEVEEELRFAREKLWLVDIVDNLKK